MADIISIVYKPADGTPDPENRYLRVPLQNARLLAGYGIEGDRKGGHPKRQLNIMSHETLTTLGKRGLNVDPGQMGEQIIIRGLNIDALPKGARLQLGSALVEVIEPRTGCDRFEHIQGASRTSVAGQMGVIARVITSGEIAVGTPVTVVESVSP